jgi:hypothetical protein
MSERYFLKVGDGPEKEVSKKEWIVAERQSGFYPKCFDPVYEIPATAGFHNSQTGVSGRMEYENEKTKNSGV